MDVNDAYLVVCAHQQRCKLMSLNKALLRIGESIGLNIFGGTDRMKERRSTHLPKQDSDLPLCLRMPGEKVPYGLENWTDNDLFFSLSGDPGRPWKFRALA